jgi:hypothetical protein
MISCTQAQVASWAVPFSLRPYSASTLAAHSRQCMQLVRSMRSISL